MRLILAFALLYCVVAQNDTDTESESRDKRQSIGHPHRPVVSSQITIPASPTGCNNPRLIQCSNAFVQSLGLDGITTQSDEIFLALDSILASESMDGLERVCKAADEFSMCINNEFDRCFTFANLRELDVMFSDSVGFRGIVSALMEECMAMKKVMDVTFSCEGKIDGLYVREGQECTRDHVVCVEGKGFHMMCPAGQAVSDELLLPDQIVTQEHGLCRELKDIPRCAGQEPPKPAAEPAMADFKCPRQIGKFTNPDKECSMFFMTCTLGKYTVRSCREGYFDGDDLACKPKNLIAACRPPPPPLAPVVKTRPVIKQPIQPKPFVAQPKPVVAAPQPAPQAKPYVELPQPKPAVFQPEPVFQPPKPVIAAPKPAFQPPKPVVAAPKPAPQAAKPYVALPAEESILIVDKPTLVFTPPERKPVFQPHESLFQQPHEPLVITLPKPAPQAPVKFAPQPTDESILIVDKPTLVFAPPVGKPAEMPKEMEFDCIGLDDGNYHNPKKSCSQFYISCSGGELLWRACPEGLKFEEKFEACLAEEFVAVCGGNPDLATTTLPTTRTVPREPVPFQCAGLEDGSYYDTESHCSPRYFRCSGGEATVQFCPKGLVWDGLADECESPEFVITCGGSPRLPTTTTPAPTTIDLGPPFDCSNKPDGNFPNPELPCSDLFISCSGGAKNTIFCAQGSKYAIETDSCLPEAEVPACGGRLTVPTPPKPLAPTTEVTPHPLFDCTNLPDGNYPDARFACSYSFFSCVGGLTSVRDCPEGGAYDPDRDQCDAPAFIPVCGGTATTTTKAPPPTPAEPEIILFDCAGLPQGNYPDPQSDCSSKYFSCVGKQGGELRECAETNTFYDPELDMCVFFEQHPFCSGTPRTPPTLSTQPTTNAPRIPQTDFKCPAAGNFPFPDHACTTKYIACAGANAFPEVIECSLGTFYDPELDMCGRFKEVPVCSGLPRPTTTTARPADVTIPALPVDCSVRADGFYKPQDRPCPRFFVQCQHGKGIRIDCPKGLAYNDLEQTCVPLEHEPTCAEDFEHS